MSQSTQRDWENGVSLEQGEDSWTSRQTFACSASGVDKEAASRAHINFEAFPNPQSKFNNKKQVTLLSEIDVVHSVTKREQSDEMHPGRPHQLNVARRSH